MEDKYQILKQYFGYSTFRDGQEALVDAMLQGRDCLGIMPTGSGKSLCYQIPAILFEGITLVISPLISLMKDQVAALIGAGVPAAFLNSSLTPGQLRTAYGRMARGMYKIIYVAPERLQTHDFLLALEGLSVSMVAVDEAHCISQWGQDFRPSYLKITDFLKELPVRPVVSAFTATATEAVARDMEEILELNRPLRVITGFDRPNLRFEVRKPKSKATELLGILETRRGRCGIIYCATRKETEAVCSLLREHGYPATKYHAGLSEEERHRNQDDFIYDVCPVMVATNAFGMGIDKSNVSFVIHYNMPKCLEAYYQEAGRGGRDGTAADCILLYAPRDVQTAKFLIETPSENTELEPEQQAAITARDYERLDRMVGYCTTRQCLRGYILDYFGQTHPESCGNCSNCTGEFVTKDVTREAGEVLACIGQVRKHLGYYLGESLVIRVLRGSRAKRIRELGLEALPSYGALSALSEDAAAELLSAMKEEHWVKTNHLHGTLEPAAREEAEGQKLSLRIPVPRGASLREEAGSSSPREDTVLQALKALRLEIAQADHVPSYIIFSNASLQDMARKCPRTMEEFLQVSGVGQYKAQRYGKAFLARLRALTEE